LSTEDTGDKNVAIGFEALTALNHDGSAYNVAIGYEAGHDISSGIYNTIIGGLAGDKITTGSSNNIFGYDAGGALTEGERNIAIGSAALATATTQSYNVAVGHGALNAAASAENVAVGYEAGAATSSSGANTYVGYQAGAANTTGQNTAVGNKALALNQTGTGNTAIGLKAMDANVDGDNNVAIGEGALGNMDPSGNVDMYNVAVGYQASLGCTTGIKNTSIGGDALFTDDTGNSSVAIGYKALYAQNPSGSVDMHNVAVGEESAVNLTEGNRNTIIGQGAASTLTTGDSNIIIGRQANVGAADNDFSIVIGAGAQGLGSNSTVIGTTSTTNAKILGLRTPVTSITMSRALTANDSGETFVFAAASGATITLPDSGGNDLTGVYFNFFVKTQVTSNSQKVVCADTSGEQLIGSLHSVDTDADASASIWNAQASDNFSAVTLTGVATGKIGSYFTITNMSADIWHIKGEVHQSGGSEATPFATS